MPTNKTAILFIIVIAAIAVAGAWSGYLSFGAKSSDPSAPSKYSAVYMVTGDIYFGELHWFPSPHLTNVWLLQRSVDQNNQPQVQLTKFSNAFWSPVDEIHIDMKQVVLWTSLRNESQVAKVLDNPSLLNQQGAGGSQPSSQLPASGAQGAPVQPSSSKK